MECILYLADDCNLKCKYCYEGTEKLQGRILKRNVEKAVDFMVKVSEGEEIDLTFLGGEPLLNKEMMYYTIQYIKEKYNIPFNYSITTNGIYLEKKDINFMNDNNFEISLSVDGRKETHNLNRCAKDGRTDLYEKIIENVNYMVYQKIPFKVRMTVTCNNVQYMYDNIKYFFNMGVKKFDIAFNEFENWSINYLQILEKELQKVDLWYLANLKGIEYLNLFDGKITFFIAKRKPLFCNAGKKEHFVINSRGEFYPCNYVCNQETWKLGTLNTIYNEKKCFDNIRKHIKKESKCELCDIKFECIGARCGFKNYMLTGNFNVPNKNSCNLEKILYKHNEIVFIEMYKRKEERFLHFYNTAINKGYQLTDWMLRLLEKEK